MRAACAQALEAARAKEQVARLQEEQDRQAAAGLQAFMGQGTGKQVKAAPAAPARRKPKAPLPPARPGLISALFGWGDDRPMADRLAEVVIDWVELRGDRPVPKPQVAVPFVTSPPAGSCPLGPIRP